MKLDCVTGARYWIMFCASNDNYSSCSYKHNANYIPRVIMIQIIHFKLTLHQMTIQQQGLYFRLYYLFISIALHIFCVFISAFTDILRNVCGNVTGNL